jgi:putative redox protein
MKAVARPVGGRRMKAVARRVTPGSYTHELEIRQHRLAADEPTDHGGSDQGPSPQELLAASLASCTAITVEMYARRKEWDLDQVEVECVYDQPPGGEPTRFTVILRVPSTLDDEQRERLRVIAAKCPVHRTLQGETQFEERVEVLEAPQSSS